MLTDVVTNTLFSHNSGGAHYNVEEKDAPRTLGLIKVFIIVAYLSLEEDCEKHRGV